MRRRLTGPAFFAALAAVALLPWVAGLVRGPRGARCEFDGVAFEGPPAVRMVAHDGGQHAFCCIRCAEVWAARSGTPLERIVVADTVTGRPVEADEAYYVVSPVVARRATRDRTLVFAEREEALRHIEAYGGVLLRGRDVPLCGLD